MFQVQVQTMQCGKHHHYHFAISLSWVEPLEHAGEKVQLQASQILLQKEIERRLEYNHSLHQLRQNVK